MEKEYSITEISQKTHLPTSTLRHYEQEGLLPPIKRNQYQRRQYTTTDLERIRLIQCFKQLGMSTKKIKAYIQEHEGKLCDVEGILQEHLQFLYQQKEEMERHIHFIKKELEKRK